MTDAHSVPDVVLKYQNNLKSYFEFDPRRLRQTRAFKGSNLNTLLDPAETRKNYLPYTSNLRGELSHSLTSDVNLGLSTLSAEIKDKTLWDQRSCKNASLLIFFPHSDDAEKSNGDVYIPAKKLCVTCPLQEKCLMYALKTRQLFGVWGGSTVQERRSILRKFQSAYLKRTSRTTTLEAEVANFIKAQKVKFKVEEPTGKKSKEA